MTTPHRTLHTATPTTTPTATPARRRSLRRSVGHLAAATAIGATVVACGSDATDDQTVATAVDDLAGDVSVAVGNADEQVDDLAGTLRDNGLSSIASALETIDVESVFGTEPFTFFAPNDEAFQSLDSSEVADLLTDPALLVDVLRNHTLDRRVSADELAGMTEVETLAGNTLEVSGGVMLAGADVVQTDIEVGDGVVHVVDELILP